MKKLFYVFLVIIFSFSFYSCASKSSGENEIDSESRIEDIPETIENENLSDEALKTEETPEVDVSEVDIEVDTIEEIQETEEEIEFQNKRELPEDIIEPEVTDIIENEEEPVVTVIEEDFSEPITLDELDDIPEPEIVTEEVIEENFIEVEVTEITEEENQYDEVTAIEENEESELPNQDVFIEETSPVEIITPIEETHVIENPVEPVIDNTINTEPIEEITETTEETIEEIEEVKIEIIPSRSVNLKKGEYLDVIYPGSGWVYEGVTDGTKDVVYNGRRLGTTNTTFTLIAKKDGTKIVHFYKTDTITNDYIDDYLEIIISKEKTTSKTHKIAPDYADIVPEKTSVKKSPVSTVGVSKENRLVEKKIENKENSNNDVNNQTTETNNEKDQTIQEKVIKENPENSKTIENPQISSQSNTQNNYIDDDIEVLDVSQIDEVESVIPEIDPATLLKTAYSYFNEKDYDNALTTISEYINITDKKKDEGLFLKGQILESQSGIQNIKNAVAEYENLVNNYPSSKYWDKANKRIIYLKRFYLEVR